MGAGARIGERMPPRPALPAGDRIGVLQVVASGTNGGAQEHVYSLLSQLDPARYAVTVVTFTDGSAVHRWRSLGVEVIVAPEADDAAAAAVVAGLVAERRIAVIHGHMYRAEVAGTLGADLVAARGLPRPWNIQTIHSSRVRSPEDRALLVTLTPRIDVLIAVSRAIVAKLEHEGRAGGRIALIPNGVDLTRYDRTEACCTLPQEYGFPEGTPMVGVVGRLEPEKGHPTLIDAWPLILRAVPAARLLVVGEGSRREALEAQAEALGLLGTGTPPSDGGPRPGATVVFTGRREDVPSVTAALDVAVLPSYREAQGLAVLEAMALGRPVVASDVGGIPEMIEDGVNGVLVPPHDPPALAAAIVRVLTDHPFADTIARRGREVAHERYGLATMAGAVCDLYDEGAIAWAARGGRPGGDQAERTTLQ